MGGAIAQEERAEAPDQTWEGTSLVDGRNCSKERSLEVLQFLDDADLFRSERSPHVCALPALDPCVPATLDRPHLFGAGILCSATCMCAID